MPYVQGKRVRSAVRRLDVGGKLLTNHLKEVISYRQLHVLDETYVMNGCKEDCCYVAKDFDVEVAKAKRNEIARDYVLPDFTAIRRQVILVNLDDDKFRGFMKSAEDSSGKPGDGEQLVTLVVLFYLQRRVPTKECL